jgi:hypothetical protein
MGRSMHRYSVEECGGDDPVGKRVLMLLENNPYIQDRRVRKEARSLAAAGCRVSVISPLGPGQRWSETLDDVHLYMFPTPPDAGNIRSLPARALARRL